MSWKTLTVIVMNVPQKYYGINALGKDGEVLEKETNL